MTPRTGNSPSLVKSGLSALYLTNNANTYTGGTTVNSGNLVVDNFLAVNNLAGGLTLGGGYFKYRGPNAILPGPITLAGGGAGGSGGIHVVSGTNLTALAGSISAGASLPGPGAETPSRTGSFPERPFASSPPPAAPA